MKFHDLLRPMDDLYSSVYFGRQVRVHAPPDDYEHLEYALETGVKVLSYYEKLFGEPFPLPKLGE